METLLLGLLMAFITVFAVWPTLVAFFSGAPFVPTPLGAVRKILARLHLKPGLRIYDLGCGDGRFVHEAALKYGCRATGFELSLPVYLLARIRKWLLKSPAHIVWGDFRRHSLHDADLIYCYLLPHTLQKYIPKFLKELKPGAKICSYAFTIGNWKPTYEIPKDSALNHARVLVYEIGVSNNISPPAVPA